MILVYIFIILCGRIQANDQMNNHPYSHKLNVTRTSKKEQEAQGKSLFTFHVRPVLDSWCYIVGQLDYYILKAISRFCRDWEDNWGPTNA